MDIKKLMTKRSISGWQAKCFVLNNTLIMSVVAGNNLYSIPRENLEDPIGYTHCEVAFFNADTGDGASYNEVKPLFDILEDKGEYDEDNADESQRAVFGYIPISNINKVLEL
jgi:hypothetical protein